MPNDFPVVERITDSRCCLTLRHDLHDMLMMALLTVLSGGEPCLDRAPFGWTFTSKWGRSKAMALQ